MAATPADPGLQPGEHMRLMVAEGPLALPTLSRVIGIAAARANLPVNRLEDALTIAEALVRSGPTELAAPEQRLDTSMHIAAGSLTIDVGPLRPGGAAALARARADDRRPDLCIEDLADDVHTHGADLSERLAIVLTSGTEVSSRVALGTPGVVGDERRPEFAFHGSLDASGAYILAIRGEIDVSTAPQVKLAARDAVFAGSDRVVLDLTETTFLDSTGLGVIIGLARLLRPDGDIAIVNVNPSIAKTFEITGLGDIFTVCARRADAIAALDARA